MSALGQRIAAARASNEMRVLEVPEWGDDKGPLKLYYGPVTGADISRVQKRYKDFLSSPTTDSMVELIVVKCKDADGNNAFDLEDKPILLREPVNVIGNVFASIFDATSAEEHEKN
jgi:hypothetical protein